MRIREAREADLRSLAELAKRTWADAFGSSVSPDQEAAELAETRSEEYFRAALAYDTILVAELDGALAGYAQLGDVAIPEVDIRAGDQSLRRLYVDTHLQGRGIGRRLLRAALAHPRLAAARRVFTSVWEQNEPALRLYESFGFGRVGTTRVVIGGKEVGDDLVLMLDRRANETFEAPQA
jgi:diamine N-acetyltransferase